MALSRDFGHFKRNDNKAKWQWQWHWLQQQEQQQYEYTNKIQQKVGSSSSRRHASISMAACVVTKGRNEQLETIGPDDDDDDNEGDDDGDAQRSAA